MKAVKGLAALLLLSSLVLAAGCGHKSGVAAGGDKTPAQTQADAQKRAADLAAQAQRQGGAPR